MIHLLKLGERDCELFSFFFFFGYKSTQSKSVQLKKQYRFSHYSTFQIFFFFFLIDLSIRTNKNGGSKYTIEIDNFFSGFY